jgi:hypothetical protein
MKRVIAFADRGALPLVKLLVAANLLFFLSFALMVALATERARAEEVTCSGKDMLAELKTSDPAALARIEAEAGRTENGEGLLWKIEKDGGPASYLFGTMHVTDPRVTALPPAAQTAYDASGTVVIETTDVLDQSKMAAIMVERPELMMFTDDTTLASLIPPGEVDGVNKALEARGIPPYSVAKMKPWIISAMIALPACELQRKAGGAPVLDIKLGHEAAAAGKTLEGLETAVDQLEAMASLPMQFHIQGLVDTLKLGDRVDDVIETMIVLYTRGDTGMFWPLFNAVLPDGGGGEASGYAAFEETMITARNRTMAEHAVPILDAGNAFIAVGALHLPGPEGLVALLRKAGYTVSRADRG